MYKSIIVEDEEIANHPSKWQIKLLSLDFFEHIKAKSEQEKEDWQAFIKKGEQSTVQSPAKEKVFSRLSWSYAHRQTTRKMSKQSVSELKRLAEIRDEASATDLIRASGMNPFKRPKFLQEKRMTPAERGTAMHTVMQHISLKDEPTENSVNELLQNLIFKEIMTEDQAAVINVKQIIQFFQSELGEKLLHAKKVLREVPFTLGVAAREIYENWDGEDEQVIVQGVIDCLIEEDDGRFILIDYKTDAIHERFPGGFDQAKEILKQRYETQIGLYARAFEEIMQKHMGERYLYFFDAGQAIKM